MRIVLRGAAWLLALALGATPLLARPFTVEDMLRAERFGEVMVDPSGRWLVYAVERPLVDAPRFDIEAMDVLRSRLFLVDLAHPGAGKALVPGAGQAGMVAYGFSPAGTRIVVARLAGETWQLGIVTIATGAVTWFDVSSAYDRFAGTWCWLSENRLALITGPDGPAPFGMRANAQMVSDLTDAWRKARVGREASVTAVGSGRHLSITPHNQNQRLLLIDVESGAVRTLARGDLTSVCASPGGRTLAVTEQAESVGFAGDQLLEIGTGTRRQRLAIIDTASGQRWVPCSDCDLMASAPAWRADGKALLFAAHRDTQSVATARLWRVDLSRRRVRAVDVGSLVPVVNGPPNVSAELSYGWMGATPLLFAHGKGAATRTGDWYRLHHRAANCLTCALAITGTQLVPGRGQDIYMIADRGAWRLTTTGAKAMIAGMDGTMALPAGADRHQGLVGWRRWPNRSDVLLEPGTGRSLHVALPPGLQVETASAEVGAVVARRRSPAGVEQLAVVRPDGIPIVIATINASLDAIDVAAPQAISHVLPDGTPVTSWLFTPPGSHARGGLPTIVIPYPGRSQDHAAPATPPSQLYTNVMVLVGHGYAVLLPSVPAVSRLNGGHYPFAEQILSAVDAAVATGRVDPERLGLFGHSFGGLAVATVATQTRRFKAIVASSGTYDLVSQRGIFTPWTRLNPGEGQSIGANGGWAETGQAMLGATPWADPQAYVAASPVFHADKITTPILIQAADADFASLQQGEELFSALARQGKDAELVTYWGEGHVPVSPANLRDYYARVLAWFDAYLLQR